jgi:MipA family protein
MKKLLLSALLSALPFTALAQVADPDEATSGESEQQQGPPRWNLGMAAVINDSPYAGEGTRLIPIPFFGFQGERFFVRGLSAGWQFVQNDSFELAAVAKFKLDGFKVNDLGRSELATNGIDYRLLEDRDSAVDLGLSAKWKGGFGELETEILADATDTSGGQEVSLQYSYGVNVGRGQLSPNVSAKWLSEDTANYYYGTLDKEAARGVVDYKPGSVVIPSVGVSYFRPIGKTWSLLGFAKYDLLPDEITDSPLVEPDTDGSFTVFVGFSRGF